MEKKSSGVLQGQINTIVSKAPILSPIFSNEGVGVSLREIYRKYTGLSEKHTKIFINGEEVSDWGYNPKAGDTVSICQVPQGVGAFVAYAIIAAVVGLVVGFALYSMIDQPTSPGQGEQLQRVTGAKNTAKPYEPIPAILGTRRVVPTYAAQPYTYWVGDKQWLKMLLCVGYGPLKIEDIKIGDTPIEQFRDLNYRVVDWYTRQQISTLRQIWNTDVQQDQVNQELGKTSYISRAAPAGTNKIRLDLIYPQGLWRTDGGSVGSSVGALQFRYQANGQWYSVARVLDINSSWVATRSLVKDDNGRYYVVYRGGSSEGFVQPDASNGAVRPALAEKFDITDRVVLEQDGYAYIRDANDNTFKYVNTVNYYHSTRDQLIKSFNFKPIDPVTGDLVETTVPFEVKRLYWDYDPDGASFSTTLQLNSITYEINEDVPDSYFGVDPENNQYPVLIALDVRATEQLSGVIDNLSCKATSCVPTRSVLNDWKDLDIFTTATSPTNNPARLYKWALQGYFSRGLVDNNKIDNLSLLDWETTCDDEGWEANEIVNYKITVKDLLSNIAFTGRAFFSMTDGQYSIIENKPKSSPVQVFTQKNSAGLSSRREFPLATDGIEYTFANGDFQDQEDEGFYGDPIKFVDGDVDAPRAGANFTGRFDDLELWGTTDPDLARRHARFAYNERKLRREVYQLETDIESLVARRGDKVAIAHDMILVGLGQGFLKAVGSGTFELDEQINLIAGTEYTLTVRSINNGVEVNTLTATYNGDGQWTGTLPSSAAVGDLVAYGEGGTEVLECLVTEVAYSDNFAATVTLKNYAPQLYDLENNPLPQYQTGLTPERRRDLRPQPPVVSANAGEFSYESNSITVDVARAPGDPAQVSYFTLEYRYKEQNPPEEGGSAQDLDATTEELWIDGGVSPASNGRFTIPISNLQGNIILVRANAVNEAGVYSDSTGEVEILLDDNPAPDVEDFTLEELTNTPKTPDGTRSTLVITIVPPLSLRNYAYSIAEYRQPGQEEYQLIGRVGWNDENQIRTEVISDGRQYEVRVRSVSVYGVTNGVGLTKIITTTNVLDPNYDEENPYDVLPVPNVTGLELFGQGNDTEFTGQDAKFTWKKASVSDWVDIGYEGLRGAGASRIDQYFRDYQVEIWAEGEPLRTEFVTDNFYIYNYEKNAEDYLRINQTVGAYREFEIRVLARGRNNQVSEKYAILEVANTAPEPLQSLRIDAGFTALEIQYNRPDDLDYAGTDVWVETTSGFDPETTDPVAVVSDNSLVVGGLTGDTEYFIRLRPFDLFGRFDTDITAEFSVTTKTATDLVGLSGWAYQINPADRAFINENLAAGAVESTKIVNLTAAKITAGVINATETITTEGIFRSVDDINTPQYQVGLGPTTIDGTTYLMWAYDAGAASGQKLSFGIDELGNASFKGSVTIQGGSSGIANLSDAGSLAGKNQADSGDVTFNYAGSGSKGGNAIDVNNVAGENASNVKFGSLRALSGLNSAGDVARVVQGSVLPSFNPSVAGLALTNQYLGWHNGNGLSSGWQTYIKSDGQFHFGGDGDNFIDYNGTNLVFAVNAIGSGSFVGSSSVAFGTGSLASGVDAIAFGVNSSATTTGSISIGSGVDGGGAASISIGFQSSISGDHSVSLGSQSTASGDRGVAVGYQASASLDATAVGPNSSANTTKSVAYGSSASTDPAITSGSSDMTALGSNSFATSSGVAVGGDASATGTASTAVGSGASSDGNASVCIGAGSFADGARGVKVGQLGNASGVGSLALGYGTFASAENAVNIAGGDNTTSNASTENEFLLGNPSHNISVPGNFSVTGTKNFRIPHPVEEGKWVYHGSYEGPAAGGTIYRYAVTCVDGSAQITLPDYFQHINKNVMVFCQADRHFGSAYGEVDGNTCTITSNADGDFFVMITGERCDDAAERGWKGDIRGE